MPKYKLTREEVVELLNKIIDYLLANPTTYAWKGTFLYPLRLSQHYLAQYAYREDDEEIRNLWKIVGALGAENMERAVGAGILNAGFGQWRLKCYKNGEYSTLNENLQNEKLKAEIGNIKSETAVLDTKINIGWAEDEED